MFVMIQLPFSRLSIGVKPLANELIEKYNID